MKFKKFARWLLEQEFAEYIRYLLWLQIAKRDSLGTARIADRAGYEHLDVSSKIWTGNGRLRRMFILGSGSSVNELDSENFRHIEEGISIGINAWALHSFVPDMYSFETGQDGDGPSEETRFVSRRLQRPEVINADPQFLFLRPTPPATARNLVQVPEGITYRPLMYGRANVWTQRERNLQGDLRLIARAATNGRIPSNVLPDNGASVIRLIWLSALQGFRDIVLVGIDLNSTPYFWHQSSENVEWSELRETMTRPIGTPHNSLETLDRPFPVDFFIKQLSTVLREEIGVVLWISSHSSSLARFLPVYPWASDR